MTAARRSTDATSPDGVRYRDLNGNGVMDPYEDPRLPVAERVADLVGRLVGDTTPETATLVRRVASNPRGRRPEAAFEFVTQAAARRRQRLVAHVTVAAWPTASSIGSSTSTGIDRNVPYRAVKGASRASPHNEIRTWPTRSASRPP